MRSEEISGDVYELDGEVYKPRKAIIGMCMWWQYHLRVVLLQFWLVVMLLCFWLLILSALLIGHGVKEGKRSRMTRGTE